MPSNLNASPNDPFAQILINVFGIDNVFGAWKQVNYGNGPSWEPDYDAWRDGSGWTDWGIHVHSGFRAEGFEVEGYPTNYQYVSYLAFRAKGFYDLQWNMPIYLQLRARAMDPGFYARTYRTTDPYIQRFGDTSQHALPPVQVPQDVYLRPAPTGGPISLTEPGGEHRTYTDQPGTYRDGGIVFWDGRKRPVRNPDGSQAYDDQGYPIYGEELPPKASEAGRVYGYRQERTYYEPPRPPVNTFDRLRSSDFKGPGRKAGEWRDRYAHSQQR